MDEPRLVLVEWDDACFYPGWDKDLDETLLAYNQSVGYLLSKNARKIVLASSWTMSEGDDTRSFGDYTVIPRKDVRKLIYLKPPRNSRRVVR